MTVKPAGLALRSVGDRDGKGPPGPRNGAAHRGTSHQILEGFRVQGSSAGAETEHWTGSACRKEGRVSSRQRAKA